MSQESVSAVSQTERHVSNWNLPNILTVVRIIAVPFFVVVLLAGGTFGAEDVAQRWLAFALFIAAMITDWLTVTWLEAVTSSRALGRSLILLLISSSPVRRSLPFLGWASCGGG